MLLDTDSVIKAVHSKWPKLMVVGIGHVDLLNGIQAITPLDLASFLNGGLAGLEPPYSASLTSRAVLNTAAVATMTSIDFPHIEHLEIIRDPRREAPFPQRASDVSPPFPNLRSFTYVYLDSFSQRNPINFSLIMENDLEEVTSYLTTPSNISLLEAPSLFDVMENPLLWLASLIHTSLSGVRLLSSLESSQVLRYAGHSDPPVIRSLFSLRLHLSTPTSVALGQPAPPDFLPALASAIRTSFPGLIELRLFLSFPTQPAVIDFSSTIVTSKSPTDTMIDSWSAFCHACGAHRVILRSDDDGRGLDGDEVAKAFASWVNDASKPSRFLSSFSGVLAASLRCRLTVPDVVQKLFRYRISHNLLFPKTIVFCLPIPVTRSILRPHQTLYVIAMDVHVSHQYPLFEHGPAHKVPVGQSFQPSGYSDLPDHQILLSLLASYQRTFGQDFSPLAIHSPTQAMHSPPLPTPLSPPTSIDVMYQHPGFPVDALPNASTCSETGSVEGSPHETSQDRSPRMGRGGSTGNSSRSPSPPPPPSAILAAESKVASGKPIATIDFEEYLNAVEANLGVADDFVDALKPGRGGKNRPSPTSNNSTRRDRTLRAARRCRLRKLLRARWLEARCELLQERNEEIAARIREAEMKLLMTQGRKIKQLSQLGEVNTF
ncbi:hypothetical protein HDU93_001311 [Gonapodya sp. JEL0774]|nr:hypothetical protein HDU93_001311 [Gonapodya sp. JEL0774]